MAAKSTNTNFGVVGAAFDDLAGGTITDAATTIDQTVTKVFSSVTRTILGSTLQGKSAVKSMVDSMLADLARIAVKQISGTSLQDISTVLSQSLSPLAGARAAGGPVDSGLSYLVGEQGPELFVPSTSGAIAPNAALSSTALTFNVQTQNASSFVQSESQIAAMMLKALSRGKRNL